METLHDRTPWGTIDPSRDREGAVDHPGRWCVFAHADLDSQDPFTIGPRCFPRAQSDDLGVNIMAQVKLLSALLVMCLPAAASERSPAPGEAGGVPPTVAEAPADEVLRLAPADAWFIAYTADLERLTRHHFLTGLDDMDPEISALVNGLPAVINGPGMISGSGLPANPTSWRVTLAARTGQTPEELFGYLAGDLVPAWNQSPLTRPLGEMQFFQVGAVGRLMLIGPVSFFMTVATRDGLIFGSTFPGEAEGWLDGQAVESFVDSSEFERLNDGRSAPVGGLAYLDLRPLTPMAATQVEQVLPRLAEALQLDNLESLALISDRRNQPGKLPPRGKPAPPGKVRFAIGVREIRKGLSHLFASTPSRPSLAHVFPPDTTFLVRGSMETGASILDDLNAFTDVIDPAIREEYEEECADFKEEFGFDPHEDFLTNFAREWAIGLPLPASADPLIAVRLASPGTFKAFMHRLRAAYDLEINLTTYRDVAITRATRHVGPFSYGVVDNVLLLSPSAPMLKRAIDAALDDQGLAHTAQFETVIHRLGAPSSKFLFLDVAEIFAEVVESGEAAEFPPVRELVRTDSALGLAVVPHDRMIALELVSSSGHALGLIDVAAMTIIPSLRQARYQSQRAVSMSNVKGILIACKIYANDHKCQWPHSLEELVAGGSLASSVVFVSPYDPNPDSTEPYYLYRRVPEGEKVRNPAGEVAVSEPAIHHGGAVFGFMDGHVEWVESPRADELLRIMQRGR